MPCLFYYTPVKGMPPHTNDVERIVRNGPRRYMDAHVHFKSFRGMAVAERRMEIGANARNNDMSVGGVVTYAATDPEWSIFDGPPADPPAWLPPGRPRRGIG